MNLYGRHFLTLLDYTPEEIRLEETIDQINEKYQDSTGRSYNKDESINTNGQPSCNKCSVKNGGIQPVQKIYQKSWLNKCPGCDTKGKLKNEKQKFHPH